MVGAQPGMDWMPIVMGAGIILARKPFARRINEYNKRVWKMDIGERLTAQTVVIVGAAMILTRAWHLFR